MGVLAGCDARRRARRMAIPCKRPATPQRARQCSQNVLVIHDGQPLREVDQAACMLATLFRTGADVNCSRRNRMNRTCKVFS